MVFRANGNMLGIFDTRFSTTIEAKEPGTPKLRLAYFLASDNLSGAWWWPICRSVRMNVRRVWQHSKLYETHIYFSTDNNFKPQNPFSCLFVHFIFYARQKELPQRILPVTRPQATRPTFHIHNPISPVPLLDRPWRSVQYIRFSLLLSINHYGIKSNVTPNKNHRFSFKQILNILCGLSVYLCLCVRVTVCASSCVGIVFGSGVPTNGLWTKCTERV